MNGSLNTGAFGPGSPLGALRSWFKALSNERRQRSEPAAEHAQRPPVRYTGVLRLLVVDDSPVNLMLMSAMLESRGMAPLLAADGAEAVALACELHFDLILMDLQMPILDGLGATAAIRRFEGDRSRPPVPVIAYSNAPPAREVLAAHGLNGSLSKPCDEQALEACLLQWCPAYRESLAQPDDDADGHDAWRSAQRSPGGVQQGAGLR